MFYFRFTVGTPYCDTENTDYREFKVRPTDEELDDMAEEFKQLNAESFEYLITGWDDDNFEDKDEEAEVLENYYEDCFGGWEEITQEEFEENV